MLSLSDYLQITIGLVTIFSPFSALPIFVSLTSNATLYEKYETAKVTSIAACIAALVSVWMGQYVLMFFGISIPAFKIAGGILLLLMSINMLNAEVPNVKNTQEEFDEAQEKSINIRDIAVVPLAIPLTVGPGSISTIIIYTQMEDTILHLFYMSIIVVLISLSIYLVFRASTFISEKLGVTGVNIISRVMGLILASISIEFIISGAKVVFPILAR